jgi:hypothetical protein
MCIAVVQLLPGRACLIQRDGLDMICTTTGAKHLNPSNDIAVSGTDPRVRDAQRNAAIPGRIRVCHQPRRFESAAFKSSELPGIALLVFHLLYRSGVKSPKVGNLSESPVSALLQDFALRDVRVARLWLRISLYIVRRSHINLLNQPPVNRASGTFSTGSEKMPV